MAARNIRFNMLLSEDEDVMLRHLAEKRGITSSDVLRTMLRDAFARDVKKAFDGDTAEAVAELRARQATDYKHR
jgi:hypothetical protein